MSEQHNYELRVESDNLGRSDIRAMLNTQKNKNKQTTSGGWQTWQLTQKSQLSLKTELLLSDTTRS
jgi:hypothetical protein